MIKLRKIDWAKIVRLLAVKDVHPIMNHFYAESIKKLHRPDKLRVRNAVDELLELEPPQYTDEFYKQIYPLILCVTGRTQNKYSGLLSDITPDRHTIELNSSFLLIDTHLTEMWNIFRLLGIVVESTPSLYFGREKSKVIRDIQKQYLNLYNLKPIES